MGRLKPGVTIEQANANLAVLNQTVAKPASDANAWSASVEPFRNNFLSRDTKRGLWLLLGAVAFVLLIACANVANLLLARGTSRLRELAVRSSLGASRVQIVRQLLIESLVLAIAGGALGVALASGLLQIVIALMPPYMLPTEADVRLNVRSCCSRSAPAHLPASCSARRPRGRRRARMPTTHSKRQDARSPAAAIACAGRSWSRNSRSR